MSDIQITDEGDLIINGTGDFQVVDTRFHNYAQQAYIRLMTEIGDFVSYPLLGASLTRLVGMANTPDTAEFGRALITDALNREQVFAELSFTVAAVPITSTSIRFDIFIIAGSRQQLILSIEQDLDALQLETGLFLADQDGNIILGG